MMTISLLLETYEAYLQAATKTPSSSKSSASSHLDCLTCRQDLLESEYQAQGS